MSRKWKIAVGTVVAVVVLTAVGVLHWGETIYWLSDGERGWSLGVAVYQVLGWGADAYRADFSRADFGLDDGDGAADCAGVEDPSDHHGLLGHGASGVRDRHRGQAGHVLLAGGMGCLTVWALLTGAGVLLFRRHRKTHSPAPASDE